MKDTEAVATMVTPKLHREREKMQPAAAARLKKQKEPSRPGGQTEAREKEKKGKGLNNSKDLAWHTQDLRFQYIS
jgi:hypothetical protein